MSDLRNPIRFSMTSRTEAVGKLLGDTRSITDLEIRPDESSVYVHWEVAADD